VRFAILGTRGIPARYGGFETFAEELSTRLTARGHQMTVYCRERYTNPIGHVDPTYRGVCLKYLPTIRHKYLDTIAHTFLSTLHLITAGRYDAVLYCNAANAVFTWMPRVLGTPVALNVDGLERNRKKWNVLAKTWYRASEWLATWMPKAVVTDAQSIADYYRERYGRESHMIPYGAEIGTLETVQTCDELNRLGLERRKYFLYVSRMEPENNALLVREAFEQTDTPLKLALIGDAPYAADYIARVRDTRDSRVVIPGAIYGTGYRELGAHCFAYIHATEVGGTHPALIEAMGRGALTLYLDTPENREVAGGAGIPFRHDDLAAVMNTVLQMPESERGKWRARAIERVRSRYSWDAVTDAYEKLLTGLAKNKPRRQ
jgi:glycosyltransferase involved in cell wall biosynthesis